MSDDGAAADPMTAWAQSWTTSNEGRDGVLPVSDLDLSGRPAIEAARLAQVVATIEENIELLGRIQTVAISNADRRALLMRTEAISRSLFGYSHTWIADLMDQHGLDGIYGSVPEALAVLLRHSRARAGQRILMAEQFGERTAITGERLDPHLAATTHAAEDGVLDEEHQQIIRKFFRKLGSKVDIETKQNAEKQLVQLARDLLPDAFNVAARRLYDILDPDGDLDKEEQIADRCYLHLDAQAENGLSKGRFLIDAEFRAYLEAAFDKWAKPGQCNPNDDTPTVDDPADDTEGTDSGSDRSEPSLFDQTDPADDDPDSDDPDSDSGDSGDAGDGGSDSASGAVDSSDQPGGGRSGGQPDGGRSGDEPGGDSSGGQSSGGDMPGGGGGGAGAARDRDADTDAERRVERDRRSKGRRQHDAMKAILRQMLASGKLGQHRGLPVTAVITMSAKDLEAASGHAVTGTGSLIRMRDAIRMASHAHHYLVIFDDDGRPLHLGRSKRLASADQRIVLIAADRGCTFAGCTRPATWSQVHHVDEWVNGGGTDIDKLTFGCDIHHPLIGPRDTDWATTKAGPDHPYPGRTLWHPPITVDPLRRGRVNHYHHPNEYIYPAADVPLPGMQEPTVGSDDPSSGGQPSEHGPGHSPRNNAPTDIAPTDNVAAGNVAAGNPIPGNPIPDNPTPDNAHPTNPAPDNPTPDNPTPGKPVPGEPGSGAPPD